MSNLYQNSKIREQSARLLFSQPRNQNQSIYTYVYMYIYIYTHTYTHMYVCDARRSIHMLRVGGRIMCICIYTYVIYTYVYLYIHTNMRTHVCR